MPVGEVRIKGLRQLNSAFKRYDERLQKDLDKTLLAAGELVAASARDRFSAIDTHAAQGFRPRMRGFGRLVVEQRQRRTTGLRPDFGSLQMRRALLPARAENTERIIGAMELMLDTIGAEEGF